MYFSGPATLHAFDLHHITRVGADLPTPVVEDLTSVRDLVKGQRAHVTDVADWDAPEVARVLQGAGLWAVPDRAALQRVQGLSPAPALVLSLDCFADFGLVDYDPAPGDAGCALLRCCAWLGNLLRTPVPGTDATVLATCLAHPGIPRDGCGAHPQVVVSVNTEWPHCVDTVQ